MKRGRKDERSGRGYDEGCEMPYCETRWRHHDVDNDEDVSTNMHAAFQCRSEPEHMFCLNCLNQMIDSGRSMLCPVCRAPATDEYERYRQTRLGRNRVRVVGLRRMPQRRLEGTTSTIEEEEERRRYRIAAFRALNEIRGNMLRSGGALPVDVNRMAQMMEVVSWYLRLPDVSRESMSLLARNTMAVFEGTMSLQAFDAYFLLLLRDVYD